MCVIILSLKANQQTDIHMANSNLFNTPSGEDDKHAYQSPLEQKVEEVLSPFQEYIDAQILASALLFLATAMALICSNTDFIASSYHEFIHTRVGFIFGDITFQKNLKFWSNDVLLTLFFFLVGLEIKREFLVGELAELRKATFVLVAATGGVVVPALIYAFFNYNETTQHGWGIPIATDTAFALGVLTCFRNKVDKGVFTFLAALAIIDDIAAILVIAVFYTDNLQSVQLMYAALLALVMLIVNYAGFRKPLPYIILGTGIWYCIETANIHGTVAGVMTAFLIPARPEKGPRTFIQDIKALVSYFEKRKKENPLILEDEKQHEVIEEVQTVAIKATTPLQRWNSHLAIPTAIIILPLFALINAGIRVDFKLIQDIFTHHLSLGIFFGLLVGKPLGVMGFSYLSTTLNITSLPDNTKLSQIACVAMLTGVGFTMSLFIANLTFPNDELSLLIAKGAILLSSLCSIVIGSICLLRQSLILQNN